ncbi:hypothetical protein [Methyloglobulus sp.]|uniref:hypothetical protein n=1 Tax=Methyloglobulus sp. TaxID=2518622 RepID=UPI0039893626
MRRVTPRLNIGSCFGEVGCAANRALQMTRRTAVQMTRRTAIEHRVRVADGHHLL